MTIQSWYTPFPIWNQSIVSCLVLTVAYWPAYRFLKRQVWWSGISISWRTFHSLLWSFSIVNEAEVDVFLELSCFFLCFSMMLEIWSLVPLPFLNSAWAPGSSWFTYCWSLDWRILSNYFASMWDECNCAVVWTLFGIAFLWNWNENWPFPVLWPLLSFPNLLAYWVQLLNCGVGEDS